MKLQKKIIKLLQSLPESDRAVYLTPTENYIEEERLLKLSEKIDLEFMVIAHCNYGRQVAITDETGRHQYEYVSVNESIEVHSAKVYKDGDFAFELKEDITEHFHLIT